MYVTHSRVYDYYCRVCCLSLGSHRGVFVKSRPPTPPDDCTRSRPRRALTRHTPSIAPDRELKPIGLYFVFRFCSVGRGRNATQRRFRLNIRSKNKLPSPTTAHTEQHYRGAAACVCTRGRSPRVVSDTCVSRAPRDE